MMLYSEYPPFFCDCSRVLETNLFHRSTCELQSDLTKLDIKYKSVKVASVLAQGFKAFGEAFAYVGGAVLAIALGGLAVVLGVKPPASIRPLK